MATKGKKSIEVDIKTIDQSEVEKNPGGRPPFFNTPEELQAAINQYFNEGVNKKKIVVGKKDNQQVIEIPIPTITGLCYYLGFESRQSFYDYADREVFSYTIKRARLFIEREYEEQLQIGNTIGAIFALKNMGWIDKQELGHSGIPPAVNVNVTTQQAADKVKDFLKDEPE